jgi:hypothetical protein
MVEKTKILLLWSYVRYKNVLLSTGVDRQVVRSFHPLCIALFFISILKLLLFYHIQACSLLNTKIESHETVEETENEIEEETEAKVEDETVNET